MTTRGDDSWIAKGFDTAHVPAGTAARREEDAVLDPRRLGVLLRGLAVRGVLTVSDIDGFAEAGGEGATLQQRLVVAQESLANQRETQRIVKARAELGRGTPLDVARANALVESTEASLPALQGAIERSALRIATLAGRTPRATLALLAEGVPAAMIENAAKFAGMPVGYGFSRPLFG